ncbi:MULTISPECIES: hypothetical protein [unclassified Pseudomonas]|uniref:hypothetical protein n=1 Tax=unclassified Pseudomonas TaxID=196821 RepID=UPI00244CDFF4|nr:MULTISPECIES: hypothetical protein [unclassified Pseudomonas]MDH0301854.1 hypothetical protein [Pseudomonas sp. GD04091]MDH1983858.1 hypothetical protein [Pseudomonas sp. GD03689]
MDRLPRHGRKLSQREYEHAVVALHAAHAEDATSLEDPSLRRRELDLTIDHRLGVDFPPARRERLWQIQQRVERKRLRLLARSLVAQMLPIITRRRANAIAGFVERAFAQELDAQEMNDYFGND